MEQHRSKARELYGKGYSAGRIAFTLGIRQSEVIALLKLTPSERTSMLKDDIVSGKAQAEAVEAFETAWSVAQDVARDVEPGMRSKDENVSKAYDDVDLCVTRLRNLGLVAG